MIENKTHIPFVGVTGTNGKTTVTNLIAQMLPKAGLIGTLGAGFISDLKTTGYTTPPTEQTDELVQGLLEKGAQAIVMEASSHGLTQGRMQNVPFNVAVFTNLTQDHLDYHGSMEAYGDAKSKLFAWPTLEHAVLNLDDPFTQQLKSRCEVLITTFSCHDNKADILLQKEQALDNGYQLSINTPQGSLEVHLPLLGQFNISNYLAAVATCLCSGMGLEAMRQATAELQPACGRMELISKAQHADVLIDYAHTPDALDKVIQAARQHCHGKLWVLFGCGGDRDRTKRPQMAAIASQADFVVVTEDNARFEDPNQIFDDICQGLRTEHYQVVIKRDEAICYALNNAAQNDLIILAGKGHETYLDNRGEKKHFDERCVLRAFRYIE